MNARDDNDLVVVKVGGSLYDLPDLAERLAAFLASLADHRVLLIAGGGGAADFVRAIDRVHGLGEASAHDLAVRSLDLTAYALAAIVPGLKVAETRDEVLALTKLGQPTIVAPRRILEDDRDNPLPKSWDVTTDSIAARLARILEARSLILLKSVVPEGPISKARAAEIGLVDPFFPHEARLLEDVRVMNIRESRGAGQTLT